MLPVAAIVVPIIVVIVALGIIGGALFGFVLLR